MATQPQPLVSVIVPTKNSAVTLGACLKSLQDQTYSAVEIIVVDNHSSDGTAKIGRELGAKVFIKGPERSSQRNYGAEKAKGDYLLFIDSDMELAPSVIAECVVSVQADPVIGGVIIPEESFGRGFWAACKQLERSFYVGSDWMEAARFYIKKAFWDEGGWDVQLVSGEDWDLSQRVRKHHTIGRITAFIYHNEGHISFWKSVRKKYYYAQKFRAYSSKNKQTDSLAAQTSPLKRYRLFFSQPKKLFRHPLLGLGMLVLKTTEFAFGEFGYLTTPKVSS